MKLSKSKINTFLRCRRQFKYIYIDGLDSGTNKYAQVGLNVHEYAENIGKELKEIDNPTKEDILSIATKLYPYSVDEINNDDHAQGVIQFFNDVLIAGDYKIFDTELYIYDEKHNINGIIDIVLEDKKTGELIVFDYKTSKVKPITDFRMELCMYRMLLESQYPDCNITSAGIYFTGYQKYRVFNFAEKQKKGAYVTEKDYQSVFELIKYVRQQVQNKIFYPKDKAQDYFCNNFCTFKDRCNKDGGF